MFVIAIVHKHHLLNFKTFQIDSSYYILWHKSHINVTPIGFWPWTVKWTTYLYMWYQMFGISILSWAFSYCIWSVRKLEQQQITHSQCGISTTWTRNGHIVSYAACIALSWSMFPSGITSSLYWENILPWLSKELSLRGPAEFGYNCF